MIACCSIGGSIPVVMSYAGEFCQSQGRGLRLGFLLMFWVLGGVYVSALGWLVIPTEGRRPRQTAWLSQTTGSYQ